MSLEDARGFYGPVPDQNKDVTTKISKISPSQECEHYKKLWDPRPVGAAVLEAGGATEALGRI